MAAVPKALLRNAPAATTAVTATVPAGYRWIVTNIVIMNSNASTPSTATVLLANVTLVSLILSAGQQYVLDCRQVLDAGQVLSVQTSAASTLNFHVSGVEQGL